MTEHERAGYEEALRVRWYRPEDVPTEEPARAEWLRGWERGHVPIEAAVDVVREVMHAWYRAEGELAKLHGLDARLDSGAAERLRDEIRREQNAAWHRVRPALRALIAAARESEARS